MLKVRSVNEIVKLLRSGAVIVYPTETAYALGGVATDEAAVKKIFQIKGRKKSKTLPLIVTSLAMAREWFLFNKKELALVKKFWPGPLTLILKARKLPSPLEGEGRVRGLSRRVVASDGTAAVRVSSNPLARRLSAALGAPIVSTSANLSGKGECYSANAVKKQLGKKFLLVDAVIDVGRLPKRAPSTIARVVNGKVVILRKGPIIPSPLEGEG